MQPEWGENDAAIHDDGAQDNPAHSVHAKLIRMANQIATFFDSQAEQNRLEGVATHINKFWDPRMRRALFAHIDAGGEGLHPLVTQSSAAGLIRRPNANPDTGAGTGATAEAGAPEGEGTAAGEAKSETNFPEE